MDEGEFASAAAKKAGVEHHEVRVPAGERPQLLIEPTWYLDEPINFPASPEILAVSRYARQHVRVLLTGETADELFGGYGRLRLYRYPRLVNLTGRLLAPFEKQLRFGSRWARAVSSTKSEQARVDCRELRRRRPQPLLTPWAPRRNGRPIGRRSRKTPSGSTGTLSGRRWRTSATHTYRRSWPPGTG